MPDTAQSNRDGTKVYTSYTSLISKRVGLTIGLSLIVLVVSLFILARSGKITPFIITIVGSDRLVDASRLSLPINLLTNPIISSWRGSVEGTVVSKDDSHFTIQRKSNVLTIFVDVHSLTHLYSKTLKHPITLAELPLGANVIGEVWYLPQAKEVIVGSLFNVDNPSSH